MPLFNVTALKEKQLLERMQALGIKEQDLREHFIRSGGKGGQKVNKTSSCVYLVHDPSGMEVKCSQTRSQAMNRFWARRELCDRIEERDKGIKSARQQAQEKIRRQKRRRSRRAKDRMLEEKHHRSRIKQQRRSPPGDA